MINRDLPGTSPHGFQAQRPGCSAGQYQQLGALWRAQGGGRSGRSGQHGQTSLVKGSLGAGTCLEKSKEDTLCFQRVINDKEKSFSECTSLGRLFYCLGSWSSLRIPWARSLFLGEGLAQRGLLAVDNKDGLETGAATGFHLLMPWLALSPVPDGEAETRLCLPGATVTFRGAGAVGLSVQSSAVPINGHCHGDSPEWAAFLGWTGGRWVGGEK